MVNFEKYHIEEFCLDRKSSCEDNDDEDVQQDWALTNKILSHVQRRKNIKLSENNKKKSQVCELLLLHGNNNSSANGGLLGNESTFSSTSSSSNISTAIETGILLSPSENSSTVGSNNNIDSSNNIALLDDKRLRRQIANCNERRRMQSINAGFQTLRQLLPYKGEKMSKAAILQQTADFIHNLQQEKNYLIEENELIAQAKKRKVDNKSYGAEKMDTNEEHNTHFFTNKNANLNIESQPTDILECLKIIQELRSELIKEQQLRIVYENELRSKAYTTSCLTMEPTSSFSNNRIASTSTIPSALYVDTAHKENYFTNSYQKILAKTQSNSSAFSTIFSLQDALTAASSPFLISAQPQNVINTTQNLLTVVKSSSTPQQIVSITPSNSTAISLSETTIPSTIIVKDAGIVTPKTIPLSIGNDSLTKTSNFLQNQPSHVILDLRGVTNRFVALNTNSQQQQPHNSIIFKTPTTCRIATDITTNIASSNSLPPILITNSNNQKICQPIVNYQHKNQNNLLMSVDPHSNSPNFLTINQQPFSPNNRTNSTQITFTKLSENLSGNSLTSTVTNTTVGSLKNLNNNQITSSNCFPISTDTNSTTNGASLSQRNLQAIIEAIRHIEGGSMATAASVNINNNTSSSTCSKTSDLLVR